MVGKITIWIVLTCIWLFNVSQVSAGERSMAAGDSANLAIWEIDTQPIIDFRHKKLESYMKSRNAPLSNYAEIFIKQADRYNLDWRLVAAISGVESNFGKHIPWESYNAWGWAGGRYKFKSWENGIEVVSKSLKENYYDRGLITPRLIGPVYAPPSSTWAGNVEYFLREIEGTEVPVADKLALSL